MVPDSPAPLVRPPDDAPARESAPATTLRRGRWYGLTGFMSEGARPNSSLFGEILDWLWVPVMLLMPVSLLLTFAAAKSLSHAPFDRALSDSVSILAEQVKVRGGRVVADLPLPAREILRADDTDTVYFQVVGQRGEFVSGDRDLPLPADDEVPAPGRVLFRNDELNGVELRVAYTWVEFPPVQPPPSKARGADVAARPALVQVAETLDKRAQLADEIVKGVILPQFIILPFAAVLVWFGLARGLVPLSSLVDRIHRRRPGDLSPIPSGEVPSEVEPLITSINDLMRQLDGSLKGQQRFIANAAHQLRTPLAGIKMQTELALRQAAVAEGPELRQSLEQMAIATRRLVRMVNQLLALTRAEKGAQVDAAGPRLTMLDLGGLVCERVRGWVPQARARRIDLGVEGVATPLMIEGNAPLLSELVNNLVDNAIRYTPQGGEITVRLLTGSVVILEVEDNGIGIVPEERELVFERFYRVLGSGPDGEALDGSGLGLAIVREIAYQHRAQVRVRDAALVRGTVFSVEFPLPGTGQAQLVALPAAAPIKAP